MVRHGLVAAGRYLHLRVRINDRPGRLAALLGDLAAAGGNVVHVDHAHTGAGLAVDEVEISVQVETRGPVHAEEVVGRMRGCGYRLVE